VLAKTATALLAAGIMRWASSPTAARTAGVTMAMGHGSALPATT
jgi:hypothetical protein